MYMNIVVIFFKEKQKKIELRNLFCIVTDISTDYVNHILDAHSGSYKKNQLSFFNNPTKRFPFNK